MPVRRMASESGVYGITSSVVAEGSPDFFTSWTLGGPTFAYFSELRGEGNQSLYSGVPENTGSHPNTEVKREGLSERRVW